MATEHQPIEVTTFRGVNSAKDSSTTFSSGVPETASPSQSALRDQFPSLFASTKRFTVGVPRNFTFVDGDATVLFLRSRLPGDPAMALWELDVDTGQETKLVDPTDLRVAADRGLPPAERARRERTRELASGIVSYSKDQAADNLCFALDGKLCVFNRRTNTVTEPSVAEPVFDPRLSPDGRYVAYVSARVGSENAIRLLDLNDPDSDRTLAHDNDPLVSFGRAEFVAAEEMQRSRGFWWSPSSEQLLVTEVDDNLVTEWWLSDPTHPGVAPRSIRFPTPGTANAMVGLLLIDLDGSQRPIDWHEHNEYEYLADVHWSESHPPMIVRQTRDQRTVSIAELDLDTLRLTERRRITDDTWVELQPTAPTWTPHGLLTIEDVVPLHQPGVRLSKPGCRTLMLDGHQLLADAFNVKSIVGVVGDDNSGRSVVVTLWTDPTEVHLATIDLPAQPSGTTPQRPRLLTSEPGVHNAVLGTEGQRPRLLVVSSVPEQPGASFTIHQLGSPDSAEAARPGASALGASVAAVTNVSTQPGLVAAPLFYRLGADRLESALFFPTDYDGSKKLPVLLDPYGGPHAQRVLKTHNSHLVSQWFADHGFCVLVTDGRGTPGRGPLWERKVWGNLADPVLEDQLTALDAAGSEFDFLDLERVAIRGWSFGGYLAALAVMRRPDRFAAAIAGAPVTDWSLYDTHYTERYLGQPTLYPGNYEKTNLLKDAARLNRPLMLIHGLVDDNVVAAHTLRLSAALLAAGRAHEVLPLSGVTHMTPQDMVAKNLLLLQLQFLNRHLGSGQQTPADR